MLELRLIPTGKTIPIIPTQISNYLGIQRNLKEDMKYFPEQPVHSIDSYSDDDTRWKPQLKLGYYLWPHSFKFYGGYPVEILHH